MGRKAAPAQSAARAPPGDCCGGHHHHAPPHPNGAPPPPPRATAAAAAVQEEEQGGFPLEHLAPLSDVDEEEAQALAQVLHALGHYRVDALQEVHRWQGNYRALSPRHKELLAGEPAKIREALGCLRANQLFLHAICAAFVRCNAAGSPVHLRAAQVAGELQARKARVRPSHAEKARYVLKNMMRDWSAEGAAERAASYGRIAEELARRLPLRDAQASPEGPPTGQPGPAAEQAGPAVLVPGAGCGRLCLDLALLGYAVEGNEFSYFMLLSGAYLLNHCTAVGQWALHPWMHSNCNRRAAADQLRPVMVPDVLAGSALEASPLGGRMSMAAGDFAEVYATPEHAGAFDAVVTCFFLDTAHNVIQYMEVIWHVLRGGGVWINLGPLLYHWSDAAQYLGDGDDTSSIEPSLEDVQRVAAALGFQTLRSETVPAAFLADPRSMLQSHYECAFWTMQKPAGSQGGRAPAE